MLKLDRQKMTYLLPKNTGAPFAQMRGCGCDESRAFAGLGTIQFIDPMTAQMIAQEGGNILKKLTGMIGAGRKEADAIVPMQNEIHHNILAPVSAALEHEDQLTYDELYMLWNNLTNAEKGWLDFLHKPWADGRAARQAEATLEPYFNSFKSRIQNALAKFGGTGVVPYIPPTPIGGTTIGRPLTPPTPAWVTSATSYLPWIIGGVFLVMSTSAIRKQR